ncbi:MAG: methyltransferase domain-containing protein [Desulfuromonadaceae bacterium]|nr:methyltransferase domain-containing protein [Desulfuromonadaceae bacterium]
MPSADKHSDPVHDHYCSQDLGTRILSALSTAGKDPDRLSYDDLAAIDEFHIRGRKATIDLARDLGLDKNMQILDVGCGLGGAARYLAKEYGCRVTGLDLSADFCRVAADLTGRLGLDDLVSFQQGNAVNIPFSDASFDIVWTQHTAMNIRDKSVFYQEIWRVLKPGGRLALYDILAGPGGEVYFPVPWAREPSISFLQTAKQLLKRLTDTGFEMQVWRDVTESGRSWFRNQSDRIRRDGPPSFGLQLLLGDDFRAMAHNQMLNLEEERIALIEAVVRRPAAN